MKKKCISIVLPIYNEERNIASIYQQLRMVFSSLSTYEYEIIMVDDGSKDRSWSIITELCQKDVRVKGIQFSRNFGHQMALTAGYDIALGDAIVTMDADLQHPPELIPELIKTWERGFYIVYVRNNDRSDNFLKKWTAYIYYKLLDSVAEVKIPRNVQDFRLIDKKVLVVLKHSKEKFRYLRGMVAWTGFSCTFIDAQFGKRQSGTTGYTWTKMFKLAFDGVTGFSLFPLKLAGYVGIFVICTGILMFGYITFDALINHIKYPLFKWLVTIIYIFIGVLFLLLWLLGEYIGRIYEELKNRPLYIIADAHNLKYEFVAHKGLSHEYYGKPSRSPETSI